MSSRKGFTLVELLVVVGIIALLIAILLPSLTRAREQARLATCAANLKSVGQASQVYATEDREELVIPVHPGMWIDEGVAGTSEWGGKSGVGTPRNDPTDPLTSVWGTRYRRGPATRPLNRLLYKGGFAEHRDDPGPDQINWVKDTELDIDAFRCPSDKGYSNLHHLFWRESKLPGYDHYGNSYAANTLRAVCCRPCEKRGNRVSASCARRICMASARRGNCTPSTSARRRRWPTTGRTAAWLSALHHRNHIFQVKSHMVDANPPGVWRNFGLLWLAGVVDDPRAFFCPSQYDEDFRWDTPINPWPPSPDHAYRPDMPHVVNHTQSSFERRAGLTGVPWDRIGLSTVIAHDVLWPDNVGKSHRDGVNAAYRDGHVAYIRDGRLLDWWDDDTDVWIKESSRRKLLDISFRLDQQASR